MYPSGGTSNEALLPAGPSTGSHQLTTGDVGLESIVVNNPSNDPRESKVSAVVSNPRSLNLADNYEIVEGVPAFVWKPSRGFRPSVRLYSISSDGTRLGIKEGFCKICIYDMLDNFSFVAEWEDTSYEVIRELTFHNSQNNELVVVFRDSTVALMCLSHESKDGAEQPNTSQQHIEALEITQKVQILDKYKDIAELRYGIFTHGIESWVCVSDGNVNNIVTLCSIKDDGFRRLQIKSDVYIMPTFVYCSISQNAVMLVK